MAKEKSIPQDPDVLREVLIKYRVKIVKEVRTAKNLMSLIMKGSRSGWQKEELVEIKTHLYNLSKKIPVFLVFLLPGGILLLPLLVEILDRRKSSKPVSKDRRRGQEESKETL